MSRSGNFSSSEIWKLTKLARNNKDFGQIALTYIEEKKMEAKLGRPLQAFTHNRATSWGTFLEHLAYLKIKDLWNLVSDDRRLIHPDFERWTGIPDLLEVGKVGDIKCPFTLKSFCELSDIQTGEQLKQIKPEYYWQLVSNAILTDSDYASLYVYCPYKGDLNNIRKEALDYDIVSWIQYVDDGELPYLILGNYYNDVNSVTFEVPKDDKEFLTNQVSKAIELL